MSPETSEEREARYKKELEEYNNSQAPQDINKNPQFQMFAYTVIFVFCAGVWWLWSTTISRPSPNIQQAGVPSSKYEFGKITTVQREGVFGCKKFSYYSEIGQLASSGDKVAALKRLTELKIRGVCQSFKQNSQVYVEEYEFPDQLGIRGAGQFEIFWTSSQTFD